MTTTLSTRPLTARTGEDRLRVLLRVDAALCAVTGLVALLAAGPVAELLGPDVSPTVVRVVGAALALWAVDAALLSRARGRLLRGTVRAAAWANLAWEVGTVVLVALGAFSLGGAVVVLAVAAAVGGLGLLQLRALR